MFVLLLLIHFVRNRRKVRAEISDIPEVLREVLHPANVRIRVFKISDQTQWTMLSLLAACAAIVATLPSASGLVPSSCERRTFFRVAICAGATSLSPALAFDDVDVDIDAKAGTNTSPTASRGGKPYAPIETLVPALRLKLWVDEAYALSQQLAGADIADNKDQQYQLLRQMNDILSGPPKLQIGSKAPKRTSGSTAQLTTGISSANKSQYKEVRKDLSIPDKMAAMLNQADVERQYGMLKYAESKREKSNDFRLAFNLYTQSLVFGDTYQLTASKEDKKRMIRNDELPSLTAVITSDLDLRDLYRNQFLTSIEDAKAEVAYQVKQVPQDIDRADAISLMADAHTACQKWFDLIPSVDIDEALNVMRSEGAGSR